MQGWKMPEIDWIWNLALFGAVILMIIVIAAVLGFAYIMAQGILTLT